MQAPIFELPFINKKGTYRLMDDIGKIIVVTFWTSWCPDCGVDLPKKEQLFHALDSSKVKMITINVNGRERDDLSGPEYAKKFLNQITLVDNGREVYDRYKCNGVPTTVVIAPSGKNYKQFDDKANFLNIVSCIG